MKRNEEESKGTAEKKIKILFVCHGNICRSPIAEFVMKDKVEDAGVADRFEIASAATSSEELGNPVYPGARRVLARHGISCDGKTARRLTKNDYKNYDLLVGMDSENLAYMRSFFKEDPGCKIKLLLDYTEIPGDVDDPWYTNDFDSAWEDIERGCGAMLDALTSQAS